MDQSNMNKQAITRNPFYEPPWPRAYYFPSPERNLPDKVIKKSCLSPESRGHSRDEPLHSDRIDDVYYSEIPPGRDSANHQNSRGLNESWPDTERSSPSQMLSFDHVTTSSRQDLYYNPLHYSPEKTTLQPRMEYLSGPQVERAGKEKGHSMHVERRESESVLSRYLTRFRQAAPSSRDHRLRCSHPAPEQDFWWNRTAPSPPQRNSPPTPLKAKSKLQSRTPSPKSPPNSKLHSRMASMPKSPSHLNPKPRLQSRTPSPKSPSPMKPKTKLRSRTPSPKPVKQPIKSLASKPERQSRPRVRECASSPVKWRVNNKTSVSKASVNSRKVNKAVLSEKEPIEVADPYTQDLIEKTDRILNWSASTMSEMSDKINSLRTGTGNNDDVIHEPESHKEEMVTSHPRSESGLIFDSDWEEKRFSYLRRFQRSEPNVREPPTRLGQHPLPGQITTTPGQKHYVGQNNPSRSMIGGNHPETDEPPSVERREPQGRYLPDGNDSVLTDIYVHRDQNMRAGPSTMGQTEWGGPSTMGQNVNDPSRGRIDSDSVTDTGSTDDTDYTPGLNTRYQRLPVRERLSRNPAQQMAASRNPAQQMAASIIPPVLGDPSITGHKYHSIIHEPSIPRQEQSRHDFDHLGQINGPGQEERLYNTGRYAPVLDHGASELDHGGPELHHIAPELGHVAASPRKLENDILLQWRLRRKMELAREGPELFPTRDLPYTCGLLLEDGDPSPRKPSPGIHFTPPSKQPPLTNKVPHFDSEPVKDGIPAQPSSQVLPPVSSHQHYLFDIMTCKLQERKKVSGESDDFNKNRYIDDTDCLERSNARISPSRNSLIENNENCPYALSARGGSKGNVVDGFTHVRKSISPSPKKLGLKKNRGNESKTQNVTESIDERVETDETSEKTNKVTRETLNEKNATAKLRIADEENFMDSVKDSQKIRSSESGSESSTSHKWRENPRVIVKPKPALKMAGKSSKTKPKRKKQRLATREADLDDETTIEKCKVLDSSEDYSKTGSDMRTGSTEAGGNDVRVSFDSPVKSALNEVVSEHLFTGTPRKAVIDDSESEDDDAECCDDVMMQQLTAQQLKYTKQLTLIDGLLERCELKELK